MALIRDILDPTSGETIRGAFGKIVSLHFDLTQDLVTFRVITWRSKSACEQSRQPLAVQDVSVRASDFWAANDRDCDALWNDLTKHLKKLPEWKDAREED